MESIIGQHSEACALIKRHSTLHILDTRDLLALATACGSTVEMSEVEFSRA